MTMADNVAPIMEPDKDAMASFLEHLFAGLPADAGLVELAWTDAQPDAAGRHKLRHAQLFPLDRLDALVDLAATRNRIPGCNVYVGMNLRHPDTMPGARADDADAVMATAIAADLDEPGAIQRARKAYGDDKPTMVVRTGAHPHARAQIWWKLKEPVSDMARWEALMKGVAAATGGDPTITNPGRVMRLAGSVAWPVKPGRIREPTSIVPLREPGPQRFPVETLEQLFPPVARSMATKDGVTLPRASSLGITGKITDGRERYMRDTVLACLIQFIGENGAIPSPQELFDACWPQYERNVDFTRDGRGPEEVADKCRATIRRFEEGRIGGVETIDQAIAIFHAKKIEAAVAADPSAADLPSRGHIRFVDFLTLMTEEVEDEPDLIEPGFLPEGGFALIAGPPKAQKSWMLQDALVSCATGTPFLGGTFKPARPLRVFYLQAEMNRKLLRKRAREMAFIPAHERQALQANLIVSERFHMILDAAGVAVAVEAIKAAFPGAPPDIIAIDPLANLFDQENENDSAQIMKFLVGRVEALRQQVNPKAGVIMVHHATKKSAEDLGRDPFVAIRGGGALRGYYDSAIVIFRKAEEGRERRAHFEMRSEEAPEPITVELQNGRMVKVTDETTTVDLTLARKMVELIETYWKRGTPLALTDRSKTEGRHAGMVLANEFGTPIKRCEEMVKQWASNRVLTWRDRVKVNGNWRPAGYEVTGSI